MKEAVHRAVYGLFLAAWHVLRLLPPHAARRLLEGAGKLAGRFDRRHRRIIRDNLARAFPALPADRRTAIERQTFASWGRLAAELVHADRLDGLRTAAWDELAAAVESARGQGRGLLVLTAHVGNFELLARLCGRRFGRVAIFHRPLGNPYLDAFLMAERRASGLEPVSRGVGVRTALRLIADGVPLAVPLDQNQRPGRGVFVDLFGHAACTSTMLARLSLWSGAPVLPVFACWDGDATVPVVGRVIEPGTQGPAGRRLTRQGEVLRLTQAYTREIERMIRRAPEQWNWAHRRWKSRPTSEGETCGTSTEPRAPAIK